MNATAKYLEFFGGWVAFKNGHPVRTRSREIRVFRTEAEALKAAKKSTMFAA